MFGNGTTRPNFGMIIAKIRFDGQLPATQPVLRTGDDRRIRITVERPAPRDAFYAHIVASTPTLDLARRMAEEDTVGWLGAPVGRGIFWRLFKVFRLNDSVDDIGRLLVAHDADHGVDDAPLHPQQ